MKEVFSYTFTTIAEWKKFILVVLIVSIFTLFEPFPFIGLTLLILEKMLYLSAGAFLIYLAKNHKDTESYFQSLKNNGFAAFLFHFIPTAIGVLFALIVILFFWVIFFVLILKYTFSLSVLANPEFFLTNLAQTSLVTKILLGFYLVYLSFYSYVFLGKLGAALGKEGFIFSFTEMISSLYDFKYWVKIFNLGYFVIYLVWSVLVGVIYAILEFFYVFVINPQILKNPNLSLLAIPLFVAISTILTYFTFFSAYFANEKAEKN